jgi:hypothetical protein
MNLPNGGQSFGVARQDGTPLVLARVWEGC